MLQARVCTTLILLAVWLPVLLFNAFPAFVFVLMLWIGATCWEGARLFGFDDTSARTIGVLATLLFGSLVFGRALQR
jgi:hypothetical protein